MVAVRRRAERAGMLPVLASCLALTGSVATAWADAVADCKQGKEHPDLIIRGCTSIIARDPRNAAAYARRGFGHFANKDLNRAIDDATKAITLDPTGRAHSTGAAYYGRGTAYHKKGDYNRAIADYTKAIELYPNDPAGYGLRAENYLASGQAALGLADAERALELHPDNPSALDTRGHIFEALGRPEEAIADFRRALARDPNRIGSAERLRRLGAVR